MKKIFKIKKINKLSYSRSGSALILTMFILAGMLLVAISSSYIVTLGIKAGGIQAQSTRAYFIAEAGMELFLWELRVNRHQYLGDPVDGTIVFEKDLAPAPGTGVLRKFEVTRKGDRIYQSVGEFGNAKRAVEIEF